MHPALILGFRIGEPFRHPIHAYIVVPFPFLVGLLQVVHVLRFKPAPFRQIPLTLQLLLGRLEVAKRVHPQRQVFLALHDRLANDVAERGILAHLDDHIGPVLLSKHPPIVDRKVVEVGVLPQLNIIVVHLVPVLVRTGPLPLNLLGQRSIFYWARQRPFFLHAGAPLIYPVGIDHEIGQSAIGLHSDPVLPLQKIE